MMARDMDTGLQSPRLAADFPETLRVGDLLRRRGLHLAVAESCTAGLLGAALTAVPGSSDYVLGGVIAYSNGLKEQLLGVPRETLDTVGAVSEEAALAMAHGARERLGADLAVSITGVAGPGGETPTKPAGLIWLAVSGPGPTATRTLRLDQDHGREANRAAAVHAALQLIEDAATQAVIE
jgi:PncC family amidohydrolase